MTDNKKNPDKDDQQEKNPLDDLFNPKIDLQKDPSLIFNQYKLYADMADKISARRATTNSFFLTANSFLFVAIGVLIGNNLAFVAPIVMIIGVFFCISWYMLILYYKGLNNAKYQVINEIESILPIRGFLTEWKIWKSLEKEGKNRRLTNVEKWIPIALVVLYSAASIAITILIILELKGQFDFGFFP